MASSVTVIVKLVAIAPGGITTCAGTEATVGFELLTFTTAPPAPAGELIVIVPVESWPTLTVEGLIVKSTKFELSMKSVP
jgi:hypothetical protein